MSRLGHCNLSQHNPDPDESNHRVIPGEWIPATCLESDDARGAQEVTAWSGLTDLDGEYGAPSMFTEWGSPDGTTPIVAELRWMAEDDNRPCEHRIYVPAVKA
jgi:hypothetical protein